MRSISTPVGLDKRMMHPDPHPLLHLFFFLHARPSLFDSLLKLTQKVSTFWKKKTSTEFANLIVLPKIPNTFRGLFVYNGYHSTHYPDNFYGDLRKIKLQVALYFRVVPVELVVTLCILTVSHGSEKNMRLFLV
jgi:hypothetical protein